MNHIAASLKRSGVTVKSEKLTVLSESRSILWWSFLGRWAGWRKLWWIYKPRPNKTSFRFCLTWRTQRQKFEDRGRRGRCVFIVLLKKNWAPACDVTSFIMKQRNHIQHRKKRCSCLSLHLSPPSFFSHCLWELSSVSVVFFTAPLTSEYSSIIAAFAVQHYIQIAWIHLTFQSQILQQ